MRHFPFWEGGREDFSLLSSCMKSSRYSEWGAAAESSAHEITFGLIGGLHMQKFSETRCQLPLQTSTTECGSLYVCYGQKGQGSVLEPHLWAFSQSWLRPPQQERRKPALSLSKRGQNCFPGQEWHLACPFPMYPASHLLRGSCPFPRQWAQGPSVIDEDTSAGKSDLPRGGKPKIP